MTIVPLATVAAPRIEALLDRAFGTDRHTRTAYRVRAGTQAIAALSFAALDDDGALAGTIQCWPVEFAGDNGRVVPMVMVGPVAIEPAIQRGGIGRALTRHMLDAAACSDARGHDALMLVGDPEYYARFFDFSADRTGAWRLPGPFEARRLLALGDAVPGGAGEIRARLANARA
ncbi:N-acetyltransferase [Sphingomonas donggukensis]|uniref:N-acetyltransferase n=1 Tax=Sphingomonas donggukensis TaxID=2949093 RepID=A0ABY4TZW3_9SPHN|nr:N-acetyltransferase [Sphingomonas donggukensis]URW76669.1 N-acetyltransferase [Sphingomonas donggukensis]